MMDKQLPPDTLFIVAEADFRFYEADDMTPEEWATVTAQHVARESSSAQGSQPQDTTRKRGRGALSGTDGGATQKQQAPQSSRGFSQVQRPASGQATLEAPQDLQNLVAICNRAAR